MERALYEPEHGYYASGRAAIGRGGDFFTSVSVGELFGTLLALQFEEVWQRFHCPEPFTIVEQGAHRADFAFDVLAYLHLLSPVLHEHLDYVIVEPSPVLRKAQAEKLGRFAEGVRWISSLEELAPFTGVHFSNELLDAFPVHLVKWTGSEWVERYVASEGEKFVFTDGALSVPELAPALRAVGNVPAGYRTEINLAARAWLEALAPKLQRGCILAIDYGFPRDEFFRIDRRDGTLSAYSGHRREHDPLARPGEIDLTTHVEFTSLAERALAAGLDLLGYTDQHHFIIGLSRLHFDDTAPATPAAQKELRALQTLMHPQLFGRSFKALCLGRGLAPIPPLAGFQFASDPRKALGF